jgi:hypothetical protein
MTFKNLSEFGVFLKKYSNQFRGKVWFDKFIEKYDFIKSCCKCKRTESISDLVSYVKTIPDIVDIESLDKLFSLTDSDTISLVHKTETILFLSKP